MAFSLRNLARGIKDDLNLWDNGKSHGNNQSNPPPASTAQAKSSFKPLNNSVTRGLSRSIDQVNPFDNGRTWQQTTPTNNSSFIQQGANLVKPIVKPFTETADFAQQQTKLGLLNATGGGNTDYANQVRAGRDESYQQSLVPMASRTYNRLSEVPIVGDVIAPGKRQAATANENKIKQVQTQIDSVVQPKVAEIQQGIKSGIYDRQKGAEAIQQLMETSMIPSQMLQDSYNQKLQSAGFDQNTSKAQMFGATAGDLANLASFAVAPASGQALSSMVANQGLKQAVKIGGTDLLANGLLGGVGAGTSALGQGANWQDALKAGGTGVALNTALMGAGYIKGIHQGTANTIAGKASPTINGVKPTTKLIKPLDENGSFRVPFTKGEPGDTLFNIQNPDGARMSKPLNVQDQFNSSNYQPPIKKTSRVQIETPGPRPDKPLSGAALQSKLSKNPGAAEDAAKKSFFKPLDSEGSAQVGGPLLPIPKKLVEKLSNKGKGQWEDEVVGDNTFRVYKETPIVGKKQSSFAKGVTKSNEISPELQAKVKAKDTTYTPITNADQVKVSEKLIKGGYKKAATDVTSRLEKELGKIDGQDVADTIHVIKELDKRGGEANLQQATMLSEKLSEHLTKAGQTIQASSILNNRTPEGMAYGARKFLKSHNIEVTPEIQKVIKTQVDEIAKLKPGEARNYKIAELQQKISTYVPSTRLEKIVGLWKAGLLTGIKTQTGNTLSGVATNVLKTASDAVAAPIDAGFSALGKTELGKKMGFTGERSKSFTMRGKASGALEGAQKGWKSLKTGIDERNMEANKFDTKRLVFSNSIAGKVAQKYTDGVYGLMGAADRPNYYSNLRNNLYDLAITDAKNKGLKGPAREAHIQKFIKEPPMKALETANKAANTAIFANDTALSKIAGGIIEKAEEAGPGVGTAAKVALPFTKVPSAVATRLVDYSPFGAVKTIAEQIKNVKKGGVLDQRALSEGLSQSLTGTGTMWLGAQLHNNGLMTGSYPTDKKEQELWKLEGKQPNSIKIGGKWQSFNYTSPIGQILAVGGKIDEAKQKGGGKGEQATAGIFAIPKTVSEQSFLQGINGIQDAINDPEKQGFKFIKNQAASVIPTLSADIAKATDSKQRQSNTILEAGQAKIPGLNQKLLPKQDAFGEALPRASSSINTLANPFRPSDVRPTNDLNTELRRLQDQKLGVMPDSTDKQLKFGKETINLNPQQLFDKNTQVGKKTQDTWNAIIKTPEYQKMTDEQKQKTLSNSLSDIKALYKGDFAVQNDSRLLDSNKLNKNQIKLSQGDASSYLKTKTSTKTTVAEDEKAYEYRKTSSKNSLDMSRALNNNDISQYMSAAKNELDALERLKKSYDPKTEQDKINSTIKKQESLQNKVDKYNDKGYLKKTSKSGKGSKGKKGKFDYSKRLVSGTASTSALRNIVKGIKISRKRITK